MRRLHRSTVIVLLLSVIGTAVGSYFIHDVVRRSEQRLLQQKAAEAALILASMLNESYGAGGRSLAAALKPDGTVDPMAFAGIAAALQKPTDGADPGLGVAGVAVVDAAKGRVLASAGAISFPKGATEAATRTDLVFTGLVVAERKRSLGMAIAISRTAVAYMELPVEATVQDVGLLPGQPFAGLDYAIYIGEPTPAHLIWTNVAAKRLDGQTAKVYAGANTMDTFAAQTFDAKHRPMLIQLRAQTPLTGEFSALVPWLLFGGGLLSTLVVALLLETAQRRRDGAFALVAELECRNVEVQDAVQQRAEAEERLRQSQRLEAVGQLAGGIAHDFNNLLAVIISYAGFVKTAVAGQPAAEDVEEIDKAAHRAAELTQQLLMFSRREPTRPTVVDARALVADRERLLRRTLSEDIELVVELPDHPVHVRADAVELDQVVMNLVVNARDAMPTGGRLHVLMTEVPSRSGGIDVQLVVADDGTGMGPEVIDHAFEPFFTTKEVGRGTGLGLATVYGIVTRWGGEVRLTSRVGHGTSVTVQLPRCVGPDCEPHVDTPARREIASGTVLLVEDEDGVRRAAERILSEAGFEVLVATDGQQAIELFGNHHVDVLVSDVVMPGGMSGPDLAEACRLRRPNLPVVLATGHSRDHLTSRGPLPEGTQMLTKPFTATELVEIVRQSLDERKALA